MARRQWWQNPQLRKEEDLNIHRKVSWLELFFDLFFVVIISAVSHNLSQNLSWNGILELVLSFIPVWWVWIGFTVYNERFETQGLDSRVFTLLLMVPVSGMAVFAVDCTGRNFVPYVLCYAISRSQITFNWARAGYFDRAFRKTAQYYVAGFSLAIALSITSVFIDNYWKFIVFGFALLIDLFTPTLTIKFQKLLPRFSTSKLPERFGLIVIIVLGEVVVSVINGVRFDTNSLNHDFLIGVLCLFLGFGFWWIYFDFIGRRKFKSQIMYVLIWNYLHSLLLMGFMAQGAGIFSTLGNANNSAGLYVLTGGFAFSMVILGLLELVLHRDEHEPTHPVLSPLIKIAVGVVAAFLILYIHTLGLFWIMSLLLILQLVPIVYGIYVWFTQEISADASIIEQNEAL